MSEINKNFIVVHGWMVSDLKLKGNELFVYAMIYGFSQDGVSEFRGSLAYIEKWLNMTRKTAIATLTSLVEKGLIVKTENVVNEHLKFCAYKAPLDNMLEYRQKIK